MADLPYPLTAEDLETLKTQVFELIRVVYEEKIGGADLGDVFAITGDVLTLTVGYCLEKTSNTLEVKPLSTGGLQTGANGLLILCKSTGGLETDSDGLATKINPTGGLASDADGLYIEGRAFNTGSKAWTPGLITNGSSDSTTLTVSGASLGDPAIAGFSAIPKNGETGWEITAHVFATNTVYVKLTNNTGGDVTLGTGTLTAMTW